MSFVRKILAQGRIRTARANLSKNPSPRNYVALAQEYVRLGLARETLAITHVDRFFDIRGSERAALSGGC